MLKNSHIAELLAREAESASHFVQKAFRRAARMAFIWPEEAAALLTHNRRHRPCHEHERNQSRRKGSRRKRGAR
jgi:hypothetical protein